MTINKRVQLAHVPLHVWFHNVQMSYNRDHPYTMVNAIMFSLCIQPSDDRVILFYNSVDHDDPMALQFTHDIVIHV